ncbi:aspartate dehydrogenase [Rhodoplanes sp. Z2-YC6860]|uniref:aspartate dehydrogenase n=1 Tax=Rhodoplanes sp. Z2-YC6860 TaxID=674703 RepID=UPI00078C8527|nr:aspartate dehydrogenase [Rhodoplanes sp. Z2-YC6860]AMN44359.1 L-aspartate dehydrogenase [Rhodoplanes sp. Z2-YC6860]
MNKHEAASPPPSAAITQGGPLRVAIVGLGAIGATLADKLKGGAVPGIELVAVSARDTAKAERVAAELGGGVRVAAIADLPKVADLAIECAPAAILEQIARPMLEAGKKVMVLSVGALLSHPELLELAGRHHGQIIVPTGALLGLDAVAAAAEGVIHSVRMKTTKPIKGLLGAPYLVENKIDVSNVKVPTKVFEGTAREAAIGFPANLNVAVALSLAGIGPDRTVLEIWADPAIERNTHQIMVDADSASFEMTIRNIPSENPKTGKITPLSAVAALRKLNAPLRVGS